MIKASVIGLLTVLLATPAWAAGAALEAHPPAAFKDGWPHQGITGTFDRAALQRGFQVYKEVCASCHSMNLLSYRNLTALGFSEDEVKAIAAGYTVKDGPNDEGEMFERPGRPSDHFFKAFPNDQAARAANNGALPPDLSLMIKARHNGENYVYSLLTGYKEAPADMKMSSGMYYNPYFSGGQIAMAPPLNEGGVTFADGTTATVSQMAQDVTQFMTWAAEPKMEDRKQTGIKVIIFLSVFALIMYLVKRKVWADLH